MSDKGFLEAICASPQDDGPRLIYADWLEEHGDPERAEFIRTQIELAKLPEDDPRRPDLEERERDLLGAHAEVWRRALPSWARKEESEFRRGFVGHLGRLHTLNLAVSTISPATARALAESP